MVEDSVRPDTQGRDRLVGVLVGVVLLALPLFLFWRTAEDESEKKLPSLIARSGDPLDGTLGGNSSTSARRSTLVDPISTPLTTPIASETTGRLQLVCLLPDGAVPGERQLVMDPYVGVVDRSSEGFIVDELPPGRYSLTIFGGELVPVSLVAVEVSAGVETSIELWMSRGIRPRGRILDALSRAGIAKALIRFGEFAQIQTDANGAFRVDQLIPRQALDYITIQSVDYDLHYFRRQLIPDPGDIELSLGGGGVVELSGILDNQTGAPLPSEFRVRLFMNPAVWELRRDTVFTGTREFRFRNLYRGRYRIEVSFPDGSHSTIRSEVQFTQDRDVEEIVLPVSSGVTVSGQLIGPVEARRGLEVQLRDRRAKPLGRGVADADGLWKIPGVQPGTFNLYVKTGQTGFYLGKVIVGAQDIVRDIDVLRHRLIDK